MNSESTINKDLVDKIKQLIEDEARSCSMEAITPLYVYRHWGGKVDLKEIEEAFDHLSSK